MGEKFNIIGKGVPLKDAYEKVSGQLKFAVDITLPRMLTAKILRSPYPHARIVKIDTSQAEALPGVKGVITHKNTSSEEWEAYPNYNFRKKLFEDTVCFVGDKVAALAAINVDIAEEALGLIEVEYEELPHVFRLEDAMKPDSPVIRERSGGSGNMNNPALVEWGDVEKGLAESEIVVEHTTTTGIQQHVPLGLNAFIADWEGDKLTMWTSTQAPFELRDLMAKVLKMPHSKVRIMGLPTGGSFGLWWCNEEAFIAAILARNAKRPVKLELTREEIFATTKVREATIFEGKLGLKKDGTFTAMDVKFYMDNGAYGNKHDSYQAVSDLWGGRCPHGRFWQVGVLTNKVTGGCMRGVGDLEMNFGMEQLIDKAAEKLGLDPIKIRLLNHIQTGDIQRNRMCTYRDFNLPFPKITLSSCALTEAILKGAEMIGWNDKWKGWGKPTAVNGSRRRGVGMATAMHQSTMNFAGPGGAMVKVNTDGSVHVLTGAGRFGQGVETTQAQIVAEELGVTFENIQSTHGDTETCPWCTAMYGSICAHQIGRATLAAAKEVKRQICGYASRSLGVKPEELDMKDNMIFVKADPKKRIPLTDVTAGVLPEFLSPPKIMACVSENVPESPLALMFIVHFVEVEVDTETGKVKVLKYVAVHESGTILNHEICENQVSGGVYQGAGFSLAEDLVFDEGTGAILNPNLVDYKVFKFLDLPKIEIAFAEPMDPNGPFGAKGIGEGATCPAPAAITQAIYNATGLRFNHVPLIPERVFNGLRSKKEVPA